jgi:hypothetical protein
MKTLILLVSIFITICSFGQTIDNEKYISLTKTVLSDPEIHDNLRKYSRFEKHPVFSNNRIFIFDTTFIERELIINDFTPKFNVTNFYNLQTGYINYWLRPTHIKIKKNIISYRFKTESFRWQDSTNYIIGILKIKTRNNDWEIINKNIHSYEFIEPRDLECYEKLVECKSSKNIPKSTNKNNPLFGNWQYLKDSIYYEIFFTDDSIFHYNEIAERGFYDLKYEINDSIITIFWPNNNTYHLNYKILNENNIYLHGENKYISDNDTNRFYESYIMESIDSKGFKLSDVRCWGFRNEKYNCFVESYDSQHYSDAFYRRMSQYKRKKFSEENGSLHGVN